MFKYSPQFSLAGKRSLVASRPGKHGTQFRSMAEKFHHCSVALSTFCGYFLTLEFASSLRRKRWVLFHSLLKKISYTLMLQP